MYTPRTAPTILASLVLAALAAAGAANAASPDHLQCRKITDDAAKAAYTATLTPDNPVFAEAAGCTIKTPAKLLCVSVESSALSPTPPGAADGPPASTFLCYKAKCPKVTTSASTSDQFGAHAVTASTTKLVCAPVDTVGCHDGVAVAPEECDDGNLTNGDGCDNNCTLTACGNGIVVGKETCDEGTASPSGGCSACVRQNGWTCPTAGGVGGTCTPVCGDALVVGDETCDEGTNTPSGGCSACASQNGWVCPTAGGVGGTCNPVCGDALVRGVETCDEGASAPTGGCSGCASQNGWDCPTAGGDGGTCTPVCGDGLVRGGEGCDDHGTASGDGCSPACMVEEGFDCSGEPSVCVPL